MNLPSEKLKKHRVLVVEDHDVNRLVACCELERIGFAVDTATNGEEACQRVKENEYALVFMDCQMPVMDGLTATRSIRESGNAVPVIAMTGSSENSDRERCLDAGMNDYVSKPFEPNDLQRVMTRWLRSVNDEPAINEEALRTKFNATNVVTVIAAFREDLPKSVEFISQSVSAGDLVQAARAAHSFKSACAMVGATPLARAIADIETACRQNRSADLQSLVERMHQLCTATREACEGVCK